MSTSLSSLILKVGRRLHVGDRRAVAEVTTSANSSSTTTITAARLADHFTATDNLAPWNWTRLPDGPDNTNTTAQEGRVSTAASNYVVGTGVITVASAFTTDADNRVDTGKALQLWACNPDTVRQAVLDVLRDLSPNTLHLWTRDETLVVDNLLTNWDFETFATTFTGWSNIGTPTLAQSTRAVHGTYSASIGATGAVEGIEQNILTSLNDVDAIGRTLHVRGWTWDDAASSSRLRVTFDGSTYTNGTYNTGDGEWNGPNTQYIDVTIPADLTEATISCEVASGETGLFDAVVAWVDPIYRYTVPSSILKLHNVLVQSNALRPNGMYVPLACRPSSGRILRLEGKGALTAPSADASTTELDGDRAELVAVKAALSIAEGNELFKANLPGLAREYDRLLKAPGVVMKASAQDRTWWDVEEGSTRSLRLSD